MVIYSKQVSFLKKLVCGGSTNERLWCKKCGTCNFTINYKNKSTCHLATYYLNNNKTGREISGREISGREISGREISDRNISGRNITGREISDMDIKWDEHTKNINIDKIAEWVHETLITFKPIFDNFETLCYDYNFRWYIIK